MSKPVVLVDREAAAKVAKRYDSFHKERLANAENEVPQEKVRRHKSMHAAMAGTAHQIENEIRALPPYTTAPAAAQPVASVRVLIALDEDARVRECVVLTDTRQADDLFHRLRDIWGGANVAMASRAVDVLPANLHERIAETTEIIQ